MACAWSLVPNAPAYWPNIERMLLSRRPPPITAAAVDAASKQSTTVKYRVFAGERLF